VREDIRFASDGYPIRRFEIYRGEPFERAVADQLGFLGRHLPV
jgi:hypothetical protein